MNTILTFARSQINSFKYNQQRVATVKYLGELYNYRVLDSRVIFDTLWSLVTFGHRELSAVDFGSSPPDLPRSAAEGRPYPDVVSRIDPADDCFRVRLVCTILDTCGDCFDRGALKKKLDTFLTFFQVRFKAVCGVSLVPDSPFSLLVARFRCTRCPKPRCPWMSNSCSRTHSSIFVPSWSSFRLSPRPLKLWTR